MSSEQDWENQKDLVNQSWNILENKVDVDKYEQIQRQKETPDSFACKQVDSEKVRDCQDGWYCQCQVDALVDQPCIPSNYKTKIVPKKFDQFDRDLTLKLAKIYEQWQKDGSPPLKDWKPPSV